jgi:hypothetical protein
MAIDGSYSFDPATEKDSRSRRRRIAEALLMQGTQATPIQSPWQGAARMAQALMGGVELGMEDKKERETTEARNAYGAKLSDELAGFGGGAQSQPKLSMSPVTQALMPPEQVKAIIDANVPEADRPFAYRMAQKESNFDPGAVSKTGAKGLFQFTGGTWSDVTGQAVGRGSDGRADPVANTKAFVELTRRNREALRGVLGREPTPGELAVAHQQGVGGATALLTGKGTVDPRNLEVQAGNPKNAQDIMRYYGFAPEQGQGGPIQVAQANTGGGTTNDANRLMQIATDPNAPPQIRERAKLMLSQMPKPRDPLEDEAKRLTIEEKRRNLSKPLIDPTTTEREYERAKREGFKGDIFEFKRELAKAGASNTSVNTNPGPSKQVYETVEKRADEARAAAAALPSFAEAKRLVDSGNITLGAGADLRVSMQKVGALFGLDATSASNAETFRSVMAPTVLALVKGLGAGSGISNADREFAEKAAGGNIQLEPATIKRMIEIGAKAADAKIKAHNKMLDTVYPDTDDNNRQVRALFGVNPADYPLPTAPAEPEPAAPADTQPGAPVRVNSPEEAMRLQPGTVFITPDGRRKVR